MIGILIYNCEETNLKKRIDKKCKSKCRKNATAKSIGKK